MLEANHAEAQDNHQESLNMHNGVRHMLQSFGSDLAEENVDELIKETNEWLDKTIKPIAVTVKEGPREKQNDRRLDNENEGVPAAVLATEVALATRDDQEELELQPTQDIADGRER